MMNATSRFPLGEPIAGGPVTCASCGCRLQQDVPSHESAWYHFGALGGRDARGCRIECADAAHDAAGRPLSGAIAG